MTKAIQLNNQELTLEELEQVSGGSANDPIAPCNIRCLGEPTLLCCPVVVPNS